MSGRRRVSPALLLGLAVLAGGCTATRDFGPETPVSLRLVHHPQLGAYDSSPFRPDVYIYKLNDPSAFLAAEPRSLHVREGAVPGGALIVRLNAAPGYQGGIPLGATGPGNFRYLGVAIPYLERKAVGRKWARIPADGRLALEFGLWGILSLGPDE